MLTKEMLDQMEAELWESQEDEELEALLEEFGY